MTSDVKWIDFRIVGKDKYEYDKPISVSGKLRATIAAQVYLYIFYKNSDGNWTEPPHVHAITQVTTSKEEHTDNHIFNTSIQLNKFYPLGDYKLVAKYANIVCPIEPQFELIS
ncbi:MAG: hypothetical protein HY222_03825 [Thaumarchaeota archaeon]|nr:hypothetical protein [Nitrososphaerota archaeon]MBI3641503.1 hypothetical protein [Nitrososphaerota archaeon]